MANRNRTKRQTIIYKTLYRKLNIGLHELHMTIYTFFYLHIRELMQRVVFKSSRVITYHNQRHVSLHVHYLLIHVHVAK
jgi:hypothetical protein